MIDIKVPCSTNAIAPQKIWNEKWDSVIVVVDPKRVQGRNLVEALPFLARENRELCVAFAQRIDFKAKSGDVFFFDAGPSLRVVVLSLAESADMFEALTAAREVWDPIFNAKSKTTGVDLRGLSGAREVQAFSDAFFSAHLARQFETPKQASGTESDKRKPTVPSVEFWTHSSELVEFSKIGWTEARAMTEGTNWVRYLSLLPPDTLTPSLYVKKLKKDAAEAGIDFAFFDEKALLKRKAGAFLAVTRGADDHGGGIVSLRYRPKGKKSVARKVAFVGKGITFDTGGHNLKTDGHMLGMHMDMAGSAVAAALVFCAKKNHWPFEVEAFLAIAENSIGPKAYRCNEVVKASNGKTIEVIDTDAEGRMVLSDTLVLAAESKPDLIVDFATLTGSCIRAIGKNFSGVYSNLRELHPDLVEAGRRSGERVWPFPLDSDYGKCLKSDVADTKQCRVSGGVDHIEAAFFLSQFVPEKTPWIHTDLSAAENDDGLAHVPAKVTGFGVRFAARLMQLVVQRHWHAPDFRLA